MGKSQHNLKTIWFEGEMLPNWAQLLDAAARMCPVAEGTRGWFSRFTNASGVDDSRTVVTEVKLLRDALRQNRPTIISALQRTRGDTQASQILAAWEYALETILQQAAGKQTCAWRVEGAEDAGNDDLDGGDITLRRV
jgi:hypothetical protein